MIKNLEISQTNSKIAQIAANFRLIIGVLALLRSSPSSIHPEIF